MFRKTYKYRLYPTAKQSKLLDWTLDHCRELYNAAIEERRSAYKISQKSINFAEQSAQLVEIKNGRIEFNQIYSQVLQDVLHRVDKNFKAFFSRLKKGQKAGFPRFKGKNRYDSFTYPQLGFSLKNNKLVLSKIGHVKIKLHRNAIGKIKTLTIKRECGKWYACFSAETLPELLPVNDEATGIDVGIASFATFADGTEIENPKWYKETQKKLRLAQRKVARRKKGSNRRRKAVRYLQKVHSRIRNQRNDFHHKLSHEIANNFGIIAIEDLNTKGLASGMLAKSVMDAGWSAFINKLEYKAENAGRRLIKVSPRGTSQRCICGHSVPKTLAERWHQCSNCGLSIGRDHASALEILRLGLSLQALSTSLEVFA